MGSASLYLKDPAAARFVGRGPGRGRGAPRRRRCRRCRRPSSRRAATSSTSRFHPQLRTLLAALPAGRCCAQIGADVPGARPRRRRPREQAGVRGGPRRACCAPCAPTDRRLGLLNLFWLAHSRDAAECLRELEAQDPAVRKLKYSLHPLLSSFYRRVDQAARRAVEQADARQPAFLTGGRENPASSTRCIDDGFAFTELDHRGPRLQPVPGRQQALPALRRLFFEIYADPGPRDRAAAARGRPRAARARRAPPAAPAEGAATRRQAGRREGHDERAV